MVLYTSSLRVQAHGTVWFYLRALLHEDSDKNAYTILEKHLYELRNTTAVNVHYPLFQKVMVSSKRNKAELNEAFIISHDARSKFGYMVGYKHRPFGCQDVLTGQVKFLNTVGAIGATERTLNYVEPRDYEHAKSYPDWPEWEEATQDELGSLVSNKVMDPCDKEDIPDDKTIVDSKLVMKQKLNADGTEDKKKVRLVARGFTQIWGEDFDETFSPVSQLATVRIVLTWCIILGLIPHHADVKTAFLNSTLKFEVYIKLPKGITILGKKFAKLLKSLYGLKQAARDWYELQERFILSFDKRFKKSSVDPCLYVIVDGDFIVVISTHVDDYIIATNDSDWYKAFMAAFNTQFEVKDLGVVNHILQMHVERLNGLKMGKVFPFHSKGKFVLLLRSTVFLTVSLCKLPWKRVCSSSQQPALTWHYLSGASLVLYFGLHEAAGLTSCTPSFIFLVSVLPTTASILLQRSASCGTS